MDNKNCDIICDLLPSYLNSDCAKTTRQHVEAHLKGCPACAQRARQMGENMTSVNPQKTVLWNDLLRLAAIFPFLIYSILGINLSLWGKATILAGNQAISNHLLTLLSVCLLACMLFGLGRGEKLQKKDYRAVTISLFTLAASIGLMVYFHFSFIIKVPLLDQSVPVLFGVIEASKAGSFIHLLYAALFFIQFTIFIWALVRLWRHRIHTVPVTQITMVGMSLPLLYLMTLCSMNIEASVETILRDQLGNTGIIILIGMLAVMVGVLIRKYRTKKQKPVTRENVLS